MIEMTLASEDTMVSKTENLLSWSFHSSEGTQMIYKISK